MNVWSASVNSPCFTHDASPRSRARGARAIGLIALFALVLLLAATLLPMRSAYAAEQLDETDTVASSSALGAQAATQWKTIMTPEQLRVLTLTSEGFGPGYYKIGADFTLGSDPSGDKVATCALLSGDFVIDFNGHTVQSACTSLGTFIVHGANVTFMDSKASSSKPSINSLGASCIDVQKGSAAILNGTYVDKMYQNAGGPAVSVEDSGGERGTLTINGGAFGSIGASVVVNGGGYLFINGGEFGYGAQYVLCHMAGTTQIKRGTFAGGQSSITPTGCSFPIAAFLVLIGLDFNMDSLLAPGSSWDPKFQTVYYNGNKQLSYYPDKLSHYIAVSYAQTVKVNGTVDLQQSNGIMPPTISKVKAGKKKATVKWDAADFATGYELRYSTKKSMAKAKTISIPAGKTSQKVKKLKRNKRYYFQMRTFGTIEGVNYYSAWGEAKAAKIK